MSEAGDEGIEGVLRANGLTDEPHKYDSSIHSWRCEHPDRYGSCSCFQDLIADLEGLIAEREAEAWDKGADVMAAQEGILPDLELNPYRSKP